MRSGQYCLFAPAISVAIFANKKRKKIFSEVQSLPQKNKSLFERTRLKHQKKKDDTKELEKKGLKKRDEQCKKKKS